MREIVLDTETTGLNPDQGDRIVEIGAVELWNHLPTGKTYHRYLNPERLMPDEAFAIHGLSNEFLADKPKFADLADEFLEFVAEGNLVIHNASFDMRFLNAELKWCNKPQIPIGRAIDTVAIARSKFPGSSASLDALCRRFGVDNSMREKHGALLDSELLAEVYLELIGGRQPDFALSVSVSASAADGQDWKPRPRPVPLRTLLTESEKAAHAAFVAKLGEQALWD